MDGKGGIACRVGTNYVQTPRNLPGIDGLPYIVYLYGTRFTSLDADEKIITELLIRICSTPLAYVDYPEFTGSLCQAMSMATARCKFSLNHICQWIPILKRWLSSPAVTHAIPPEWTLILAAYDRLKVLFVPNVQRRRCACCHAGLLIYFNKCLNSKGKCLFHPAAIDLDHDKKRKQWPLVGIIIWWSELHLECVNPTTLLPGKN